MYKKKGLVKKEQKLTFMKYHKQCLLYIKLFYKTGTFILFLHEQISNRLAKQFDNDVVYSKLQAMERRVLATSK